MRKLKTRLFTGLLAVMLCCTALTPAAFAYAEDPEEGTSEKPVTGGVEPEPLTPEGNLTIVPGISSLSPSRPRAAIPFILLWTGRRTVRTPSIS